MVVIHDIDRCNTTTMEKTDQNLKQTQHANNTAGQANFETVLILGDSSIRLDKYQIHILNFLNLNLIL